MDLPRLHSQGLCFPGCGLADGDEQMAAGEQVASLGVDVDLKDANEEAVTGGIEEAAGQSFRGITLNGQLFGPVFEVAADFFLASGGQDTVCIWSRE